MPRINDVGGQDGFGPVLEELDEPMFHADWEAHVFAMNRALIGRGVYNLDEFRGACHAKCVSWRCTKIDSPVWRSEGTPSDSGHIVSSG